jgi:hypothetical protein
LLIDLRARKVWRGREKLHLTRLDFSHAASAITIDMDLTDVDQEVDAGGNTVRLKGQFENFVAQSAAVTDDGTTIIAEGFAPVTYINFETVNISNSPSITPTPTPTDTPTPTPTATLTATPTATPYFEIYLPLILKRTEANASYWPRGWDWSRWLPSRH